MMLVFPALFFPEIAEYVFEKLISQSSSERKFLAIRVLIRIQDIHFLILKALRTQPNDISGSRAKEKAARPLPFNLSALLPRT